MKFWTPEAPARLGHASVSFGLDKYAHLVPDDDAAAVAVAALVDGL